MAIKMSLPFKQELLDALTQCSYDDFLVAISDGLTVMREQAGNKSEEENFKNLGLLIEAWGEALNMKIGNGATKH